ncbi:MAG: hypothetical protein FJX21_06540 [Alphaproteobacteria bacterium]|nr:hypothetical protein [Alphaproteobacteria bacterium]
MSAASPLSPDPSGQGATLAVRLVPRGGRDALDGVEADAAGRALLRARVSAPPADGEANAALLALLARALGLPRRALAIESGATQRTKRIRIDADARAVAARLEAILGGTR